MSTLRAALEAALTANPHDLAAHMAYGDLLAEQGDPRGEFIQVQLALEDPSRSPEQRRELQAREADLLKKHAADWLGPIHAMFVGAEDEPPFDLEWYRPEECSYQFSRGWLDSLSLHYTNSAVIGALAACPTAGLLRELGFDNDDYDDSGIPALPSLRCLGNLRVFRAGEEGSSSRVRGEGIASAIARMPRLEELYLYARRPELPEVFAVPMPHLRTLRAWHSYEYRLGALANNPTLGNLVTLHCHPHAIEYDDMEEGAYIRAEDFIALVRSPHLKSLANLHLYLTDIGDRGIAALVESGMLKQLRVLDLWSGCITDEGARLLAASPDLPQLQQLRLSHNGLTDEGIELLRATHVNLEAEKQFDLESMAEDEREYLFYGDCE
jgi:uncharacterized protein (TIGR02996 family)